jgi:hypothetical protein
MVAKVAAISVLGPAHDLHNQALPSTICQQGPCIWVTLSTTQPVHSIIMLFCAQSSYNPPVEVKVGKALSEVSPIRPTSSAPVPAHTPSKH